MNIINYSSDILYEISAILANKDTALFQ